MMSAGGGGDIDIQKRNITIFNITISEDNRF